MKHMDVELVEMIADISALLLKHGSEIYRVEESVRRMCEGSGYQRVEVFAVPSYVSINLLLHDAQPYHTSRRSRTSQTDLDRLHALNTLVRKISSEALSFDQIRQEIEQIQAKPAAPYRICCGYILAASMFCVFFGGGICEFLTAALTGFLLYHASQFFSKIQINSIVCTILSSMLIALLAIICEKLSFIASSQPVITGAIMLLVPGIAITNSLRDFMGGDFISGTSRMVEALLIASSIAIGVGIVMMLLKGA